MTIFGQEYNDPSFSLSGTVTRSYQVPEPSTAGFAALAVLAVGGRGRAC
jgi:hypothetical protein